MRKNFCTVGLIYFILHRSPPRLKDRRRRGRRSSIARCPAPVDVGLMWRRYNCLDPLAIDGPYICSPWPSISSPSPFPSLCWVDGRHRFLVACCCIPLCQPIAGCCLLLNFYVLVSWTSTWPPIACMLLLLNAVSMPWPARRRQARQGAAELGLWRKEAAAQVCASTNPFAWKKTQKPKGDQILIL